MPKVRRAGASITLAVLPLLAAGCGGTDAKPYPGYVEGEFVLLASPYAGQLQKLYVRRGDKIDPGKPTFALEQESERAARLQSEEQLKSAQARLENLRVGRRPPEVESLRAAVVQARAALALSTSQLKQQEELFKGGFIAQAVLDQIGRAHV